LSAGAHTFGQVSAPSAALASVRLAEEDSAWSMLRGCHVPVAIAVHTTLSLE